MRVFILIGASIFAWLASLLTRRLLSTKISNFNLFVLNFILGGALIIFFVTYFEIDEETASIGILPSAALLAIVVRLTEAKGNKESLKTWYNAPEDEDDQEYFSKRNMHGKPWWAFIYIPGWITLIGFNLLSLLGIVLWIVTNDIEALIIGVLVALVINFRVFGVAHKRKKNYDNDYK